MGGGITGQQRGGLLVRARIPQPVQQRGRGARVIERNMGGGPAHGADVSVEVERGVGEIGNSFWVATARGVLVELGSGPVQAAIVGGIAERGLVGGEGVICRCGPEAGGDLALPVGPAVLVEVVREPVQRPARGTGPAADQLFATDRGTVPGCAESDRAETDAGERAADAFGGHGGVGQGLLQPVLRQGVPFGVGQVSGCGCFQEVPRQSDARAQAASVHCRADQRRRSRRRVAVPGQQLGYTGQELDHLPVLRGRGGLGQPGISRLAELLQLLLGERGGHGDVVTGQQLPRLSMRIRVILGRPEGQGVPEPGPQRGQHQHRGA